MVQAETPIKALPNRGMSPSCCNDRFGRRQLVELLCSDPVLVFALRGEAPPMSSSPVRGSSRFYAQPHLAAHGRLKSMSRTLGLGEFELDGDRGVIRRPQRRMGAAQPGVQYFESLRLEGLAPVEH